MSHLWKKITVEHNLMSTIKYTVNYNDEFFKLAKMSLPEIKEYVNKNYPRTKANFFMKYKLQQYALHLSEPQLYT